MSTSFNWFARLVDAGAKPVAGVRVEAQLFYLFSNAWVSAGPATSGANGELRGKGVIADDTVPLAPALRLVESGGVVVLSSNPRVSRRARSALLNVDFGELTRLPDAARFVQPRAATRGIPDDPFVVGGVVRAAEGGLQAAEAATLKAEIAKEVAGQFAARLSDSAKALTDRDVELAAQRKALAEREAALADVSLKLAKSEAALVNLRTEAAAAGPRLSAAEDGVSETSIGVGDLATKLGTELVGAQTALKSSGFSLGSVTVNARGLMQGDGSRLNLLNTVDLKSLPPGVLSDVKIDLNPDRPPAVGVALVAPDVRQLTETAARRVLASVGLMLEASFGPPGLGTNVAEGQAMLQTPEPGTGMARGGRVLVVFARSSGA
ncbi:hypothetical protein [uncultured Brevundimonas sp.]|uniref:hypothetical protein n=1 Tax=uncultured Brevundimonas sp. TaxID=213418 RepID=UPI0030EBA006|tara:strand:- start:69270 stop:70406 length:1137 start_codon:yes stop_codon:yes gene_type:complete